MNKDAKIYVAGHTGLVGGAIIRRLNVDGYTNRRSDKGKNKAVLGTKSTASRASQNDGRK